MPIRHQDVSPEGDARTTLARPRGLLATAVPVLTVAALLVHPTQVTVRQWADLAARTLGAAQGIGNLIPSVNATVSDVLFLLAFVLWVILRWRHGVLAERLRRYPLALVVLLVCAGLSGIALLVPLRGCGPGLGRAAVQLAQVFLLLVCTYSVLFDYLGSRRWRAWLAGGFVAAAAVALVTGMSEYARLRSAHSGAQGAWVISSALDVDATFGFTSGAPWPREAVGAASNRNVLGAWLTLAVPLLWGLFLHSRRLRAKLVLLILALAGGALLLHGGLWLAAILAVLALSFVRGRRAFVLTAAGVAAFYGLLFCVGPQKHGQVLLDSVLLRTEVDYFRTLRPYEKDAQFDRLGRKLEQPWRQKFIEWQPALLALADNPLFGVGLGNYQNKINLYYEDRAPERYRIVKASVNLMEPGANPFYAVWLVETGFVGLLGFIWMVMSFFARAAAGIRAEKSDVFRGLRCGALAALGAMCLGSLFTDYWVRGVGTAFVFVLALCSAEVPGEGDAPGQERGSGASGLGCARPRECDTASG